jgi:hypothetical protein
MSVRVIACLATLRCTPARPPSRSAATVHTHHWQFYQVVIYRLGTRPLIDIYGGGRGLRLKARARYMTVADSLDTHASRLGEDNEGMIDSRLRCVDRCQWSSQPVTKICHPVYGIEL